MKLLRLILRLVRLPFDLVFLTFDFIHVATHQVIGLFWLMGGQERPPFQPCSRISLIDVGGVEKTRCPVGSKYGNPFLARLLCRGMRPGPSWQVGSICGCEGNLQARVLRLAVASLLLLLIWGVAAGGVGYALFWRQPAVETATAGEATPSTGLGQNLTPEERREQAASWRLRGEKALEEGDAATARLALRRSTELEPGAPGTWVTLAQACIAANLEDEAVRAYEAALRLAPEHPEALLGAARMAVTLRQSQRALSYATRAVAGAPENFEAVLVMVRAQRLHGNFDAAAQGAARLMYLRSDDPRAILEEALALLRKQDLDAAEAGFRRSIDADPALVEARIGLAQVLDGRGERDTAIEHLSALVVQYPDDPSPRIELAELQLKHGQLDEAIRLYGELVKDYPRRYGMRSRYGELLALDGRVDESYRALHGLLEENPGDTMGHLVLADLYLRRGFVTLADDHVAKALAQSPQDIQGFRMRSRILVAQRSFPAAVRVLRVLLEALPQDAELRARLGYCLEQTGEVNAAETEYRRAIALQPGMSGLHAQLAQLLAQHQRLDEAISAYQDAIERDPNNPVALNNLAMLLIEHGRPVAEARAAAERARAVAPNSPHAADTLAWCAYLEKRLDEADALSEQAARGLPDNAIVRLHRGIILKALGKGSAALMELQEARRLGLPESRLAEADDLIRELTKPSGRG